MDRLWEPWRPFFRELPNGGTYLGLTMILVIWLAAGFLVTPTPVMQMERAFIEQAYFERPAPLLRAAPRLLRRAEALRTQPPPSWPF